MIHRHNRKWFLVAGTTSIAFLPSLVFATVTFDTTQLIAYGTSQISATVTTSQPDETILVCVGDNTGNGASVTDNGEPLTILGSGTESYVFNTTLFGLLDATSTTNQIVVSDTGFGLEAGVAAYAGVSAFGVEAETVLSSSGSFSQTLTGLSSDSWTAWCTENSNQEATAGANTTLRTGSNSSAFTYFDSNGLVSASTYTMNASLVGGGYWIGIMQELQNSGGGTSTPAVSFIEATSSPDQIQQDWLGAYFVYFSALVFIVWLFRNRGRM